MLKSILMSTQHLQKMSNISIKMLTAQQASAIYGNADSRSDELASHWGKQYLKSLEYEFNPSRGVLYRPRSYYFQGILKTMYKDFYINSFAKNYTPSKIFTDRWEWTFRGNGFWCMLVMLLHRHWNFNEENVRESEEASHHINATQLIWLMMKTYQHCFWQIHGHDIGSMLIGKYVVVLVFKMNLKCSGHTVCPHDTLGCEVTI